MWTFLLIRLICVIFSYIGFIHYVTIFFRLSAFNFSWFHQDFIFILERKKLMVYHWCIQSGHKNASNLIYQYGLKSTVTMGYFLNLWPFVPYGRREWTNLYGCDINVSVVKNIINTKNLVMYKIFARFSFVNFVIAVSSPVYNMLFVSWD